MSLVYFLIATSAAVSGVVITESGGKNCTSGCGGGREAPLVTSRLRPSSLGIPSNQTVPTVADPRIVNTQQDDEEKVKPTSAFPDFSPSPFLGSIPESPLPHRGRPLIGYGEAIPVPLPHAHHAMKYSTYQAKNFRQPTAPKKPEKDKGSDEAQQEQIKVQATASTSTNGVLHLVHDTAEVKPTVELDTDDSYFPENYRQPHASFNFQKPDEHSETTFVFPEHEEGGANLQSEFKHELTPTYTVVHAHLDDEGGGSSGFKHTPQPVYSVKPNKFEHDFSSTSHQVPLAHNFEDYSTTSLDAQTTTSYKFAPTIDFNKYIMEDKKKTAWKSVLKILAALVPLGLFVAALHPNVLVVNATEYPKPQSHPYRALDLIEGWHDASEECQKRRLCDVLAVASESGTLSATYDAVKNRSGLDAGMLDEVVSRAKGGRCQRDYPCPRTLSPGPSK